MIYGSKGIESFKAEKCGNSQGKHGSRSRKLEGPIFIIYRKERGRRGRRLGGVRGREGMRGERGRKRTGE